MEEKLHEIIGEDFREIDKSEVAELLASIQVKHVMDESEFNLLSARFAILKLAKGNVEEVRRLTEATKIDFRDVIYWASQAEK
jgi:hypothetical protein